MYHRFFYWKTSTCTLPVCFVGACAAEIPHLPRGSQIAEKLFRKRSTSNAINLCCIGGAYWLQVICKKSEDRNPVALHNLILRDVMLPSYKASTNNITLHTTFLDCNDKLHVESSSCKVFFRNMIDNFSRY